MKHKGIELKEITVPQAFDPPKQMFVWDDSDDCKAPYVRTVYAVIRTVNGTTQAVGDCSLRWVHCAEIPEEPKPRRATNREMSKWLAQGNGEMSEGGWRFDGHAYDLDKANVEVSNRINVRKWEDAYWHEPTVDYMGIEDKSADDTNVTTDAIEGKRNIAKAAILPKAYSDPNFFKEIEVKIGNQIWMNQNLNLNDGGEGIYYNKEYNAHYYTWEAAKRIADKIPGWHLPSRKEWDELIEATGNDAANLRANAWDGNDKYGFAAIPAGHWYNGFLDVDFDAYFWTSELDGSYAWSRHIDDETSVHDDEYNQISGFSVRLVKDN